MKKLKLLTIIILFSQTVFSQYFSNDAYMYLFMGYESCGYGRLTLNKEGYPDLEKYFYTILWRLEGDSLVVVDTLNYNPEVSSELNYIYHFAEQKWFLFSESYKDSKSNYNAFNYGEDYPAAESILDYNDGNLILRRYDQRINPESVSKDRTNIMGMFIVKDKVIVRSEFHTTDPMSKWYGTDRLSNRYEFHLEDFQNPIEYGVPGFQSNPGGFAFTFDSVGILRLGWRIYEKFVWKNQPVAWLQVPDSMKLTKARLGIKICRPDLDYIVIMPYFYDVKKDESIYYNTWIMNKKTKVWDKIHLQRGITFFSSYKEWIYGTERLKKVYNINLDSFYNINNKYKDRYSTRYAEPAPVYNLSTGKLFFYHIPSKKMIIYDTDDFDSELLTIKDDWIYFRVFDELRRIKLNIENITIDFNSEQLLSKNTEIVPNVHHIFFAKKQPLKVEWITPKPENKSKSIKIKK
jgi:hypothetical protein